MIRARSLRISASAFLSAVLLLLTLGTSNGPTILGAHAATSTITQTKSGLDHFDSLTTGDLTYWSMYGSAPAQGAPYKYSENSTGLHLGVQAKTAGKYSGLFAESPNTAATAYHVAVTLPYSSMPDNYFNTGMYVQTSDPTLINYVDCYAGVGPGGYNWGVEQAYGNSQQATSIIELWTSPTSTMPLTQDCTIVTNGNNYLKVYLGGTVVYQSSSLNLKMTSPFNSYIEVQTNSASAMRWSTYVYYYSMLSEVVTVSGAPAGGTVKIVDSTNAVLASAPASSTGTATLTIGNYRLPLTANIQAYGPTNALVASTASPVTIWGGDTYAVSASTTTTTTTSTSTTTTSSTTSSTMTTTTSSATTPIVLNGVQSASGAVSRAPYQITLPSFNAGTGANRLLVVGVSANGQYATSVSFGGAPLTSAVGSFYNNDAEFWYLKNPTGTANIVVTMAGSTSVVVGAYAFSGVDQGLPLPTVVTQHNTAAGSPTISLTAKYSGSWVLDLASIYGGVTLASPAGTQEWDVNAGGVITGASSSKVAAAPGQVTLSWTASRADFWDDVAIELHVAIATTTTSSSSTTISTATTSTSTTTSSSSTSTTSTVSGSSKLTVGMQNTAGAALTGYWTQLWQNGVTVASGYTPASYTLVNGQLYTIEADGYGSCAFDHWLDNGSTNNMRDITITSNTSLVAVLKC
jgi:hypothetical protein